MRPMAAKNVGSLCFMTVLAVLAVLWCVVDQWNRSVSDTLFGLHNVRLASVDNEMAKHGLTVFHTSKPFPSFTGQLFLAFVQFAFMGLVFLALFWVIFRDESFSWKGAMCNITSDRRWPILIVTHIFSIFWLQALMMPARAISLGLFAASRALEIPITALLRAPLVGVQLGRNTAKTACMGCGAAVVLYCAYTQVAGCLCVWSGHGVTLVGAAFWLVYILLLLLPATNTVLQEGVLQWPGMHPVLMLSLMNLFACVLFVPVLLIAHMVGWEDVSGAIAMTFRFREISMLVLWLSLQMAVISLITVGVILMTDSFWAVALRALRVVYWWVQQFWWVYAGATVAGQNVSVSVTSPHASKWAFAMLCGCALAATAMYTDRKSEDNLAVKSLSSQPVTCGSKPLAGP